MSYRVSGSINVYADEAFDSGEIEITTDADGIIDLMRENSITIGEVVDEYQLQSGEEYSPTTSAEDVDAYIKCANFSELKDINRWVMSKLEDLYATEITKRVKLEDRLANSASTVASVDTSLHTSN